MQICLWLWHSHGPIRRIFKDSLELLQLYAENCCSALGPLTSLGRMRKTSWNFSGCMWKYFCGINSLELLQLYAEIFSWHWTLQALEAVFERLPGSMVPLKPSRSYLKDSLQHVRLGCGDIFAALEPSRPYSNDSLEFLRLVCGGIFATLETSRP